MKKSPDVEDGDIILTELLGCGRKRRPILYRGVWEFGNRVLSIPS